MCLRDELGNKRLCEGACVPSPIFLVCVIVCLFVCWRVVVVVAVWLLLCVCVEFLWFAVCVGCRSSSSRVARLACVF